MTRPRNVIAAGAVLGVLGALGQLWLMKFGAFASAPLRGMLSMVIAIMIGVMAGTQVRAGAVKVAVLMGLVAGSILTTVGLAVLLANPQLIGLRPLESVQSFLVFTSSVLMGAVIASWVIAGVAALVTWPLSLAQVTEEE